MMSLETLVRQMQEASRLVAAAIAEQYPVGCEVLVKGKHGWDPGEVTWTPYPNAGVNLHVYVKNLRTGGTRKHEVSAGGFSGVKFKPDDACCENEKRNMRGGCDNCGDPCL